MSKLLTLNPDLIERLTNSSHDDIPILRDAFLAVSGKTYNQTTVMLSEISERVAMQSNFKVLIVWNIVNLGQSIFLYLNEGYGYGVVPTGICIQEFEGYYLVTKKGGI